MGVSGRVKRRRDRLLPFLNSVDEVLAVGAVAVGVAAAQPVRLPGVDGDALLTDDVVVPEDAVQPERGRRRGGGAGEEEEEGADGGKGDGRLK